MEEITTETEIVILPSNTVKHVSIKTGVKGNSCPSNQRFTLPTQCREAVRMAQ